MVSLRRYLAPLAGFLLLAAAPAASATPAGLQVTDLVGEFDRVVDENAALPPAEQARAVRRHFATRLPGFYDPLRVRMDDARYDAFLAKAIDEYRSTWRQPAAAVRARFNQMLAPALAEFERALGPLPTDRPVFLVVSLGEFDGATRELPGLGAPLLFAADGIARYHGGGDARAFVQHELFHLYHGQRFTGCAEIWCDLWQEGLATHVAATLNPGASDAELLLTIPEPIRPALEQHRTEAVCAVVARLDGTADRRALFSGSRLSPNLPPRFGYLVGAWVAADLGKGRSLRELAELDGKPLRDAIEASLRSMASCP